MFGSGILPDNGMYFHICCWDVTVVLCHPAACVMFHHGARFVENTAVSKVHT